MPAVLGEVANRFRILIPIARGNMGEVYLAKDLRPDGPRQADERPDRVAVKLLRHTRSGTQPGETRDATTIQRFEREVRIMRALRRR